MDAEDARAMVLFKYGVIAPSHGGFLLERSKNEYYREAARKEYTLPDGTRRTFAAATIKKWETLFRSGGIEALMPKSRSDAGVSRTISSGVGEQIQSYRKEFPKITGQKIYEKLLEDRLPETRSAPITNQD